MGTFDHFNDDPLTDLLSEGAQRASVTTKPHTPWFEQACDKCGGSGQFVSNRSGRVVGACFGCKGTGKLMFKTSPQARAKANTARATKKAATRETFQAEYKAELAWLTQAAERQHKRKCETGQCWDFPIELAGKLCQYGTLTDGQITAVRKCMAKDQERTAHAMAQRQERTTDIDVSAIEDAFRTAKDNAAADGEGVMQLRLRLDTFKFAPARKDANVLYVFDIEQKNAEGRSLYLGKITEGKFHPARECTDDQAERIVAAAADPEKAAKLYGQRYNYCSVCNRMLTNQESRGRGIGPICAERYGW